MLKRSMFCALSGLLLAFQSAVSGNLSNDLIASSKVRQPSINGPKVVGATPGKPLCFRIPISGQAPVQCTVSNLPEGLFFDPKNHVLGGTVKQSGSYTVHVSVSNELASATKDLRIVANEGALALTPPLGWNSWQPYAGKVSDADIRANVDALVSSGLADHGYSVITIDDGWEGTRNVSGQLGSNERFPNMKALADYIHGQGLHFGIYSSPGPLTCQRYPGSYGHEAQDADTFASWDVDYLKYDLCSLKKLIDKNNVESMKGPYALMGQQLEKQPRDIVYSLCQYGWTDVWKWGASVGGNLWRTTNDIGDAWSTVADNGFATASIAQYAGPGHWNDPDMLVVGQVGPGWAAALHPSLLTPNEQITHISLWAMAAAPLIIGCDLTKLDQFTTDLLCNDEVLDVDQDPLGKAATRRSQGDGVEVWSRPLEDGGTAVALFNRTQQAASITAKWADIGITGSKRVRDLWQRKDLGKFTDSFTSTVPPHGTVLVKLTD